MLSMSFKLVINGSGEKRDGRICFYAFLGK